MNNPYEAFLPLKHRTGIEPEHTWWTWGSSKVHIARLRRSKAPVRMLVVHGIGAHSGALWPLATTIKGVELSAVDLPQFGLTVTDVRKTLYDDWINLLVDLIESDEDPRPLILLGASMGGLLAAEVAARTKKVDHVIATCLLDPSNTRTRLKMTKFGFFGILGRPISRLVQGRLAEKMVSVSSISSLSKMSRSPGLAKLCASDELGGGTKVSLGFLASFMLHTPKMPRTPITLAHPSHDAWTPLELSQHTLDKALGTTETVVLKDCGHFPIEEPGISTLISTIEGIAKGLSRV